MHVVATAGHVDHGKSSLVRALTGTDPDRFAEEKRRGLTLDLGFAWTDLPGAGTVAFVDVPGHERFVPTMLAGVGPVPVVLFVVAADGGWMPQSAEHLAAVDALGVRHGLLVVTRSDLAEPADALELARAELATTSLRDVPAVTCSVVTGDGLPDVRRVLAQVLAGVPVPDPAAPVRFWIDRAFTVRGAGTVVTGTLAEGTIARGDDLDLPGGRSVRVRGVQVTEQDVPSARGVARVALNVRGADRAELHRGVALWTPGTRIPVDVVDVRLPAQDPPERLVAHTGSAAVPVHARTLGRDGDDVLLRLRLSTPLPLVVGDRLLLREPARHEVLGAATVLDVAPPELHRRGAATARARVLADLDGVPDEASELRRRGLVRGRDLRTWGVPVTSRPVVGDWHVDPGRWRDLLDRVPVVVREHVRDHPLQPGPAVEELRRALELPDRALVDPLVRAPLSVRDGRVVPADRVADLPPAVRRSVDAVLADLRTAPFAAPDVERLKALGLGVPELAAAVRAGALERVGDGLVLAPGALGRAAGVLAGLPQPFTASQARTALGTSRRVVLPLLSALDASGATRRGADDRRTVAPRRDTVHA